MLTLKLVEPCVQIERLKALMPGLQFAGTSMEHDKDGRRDGLALFGAGAERGMYSMFLPKPTAMIRELTGVSVDPVEWHLPESRREFRKTCDIEQRALMQLIERLGKSIDVSDLLEGLKRGYVSRYPSPMVRWALMESAFDGDVVVMQAGFIQPVFTTGELWYYAGEYFPVFGLGMMHTLIILARYLAAGSRRPRSVSTGGNPNGGLGDSYPMGCSWDKQHRRWEVGLLGGCPCCDNSGDGFLAIGRDQAGHYNEELRQQLRERVERIRSQLK
ncbi:MAG: hypothetical protein V1826_02200 [bacterium]